jgi:hypothetical protein
MRNLLAIVGLLFASNCFAQNTYEIRADTVRIFNNCDTSELVLENHTQDTLGFLYNKGKGRTEFRKLRLVKVGASQLAIAGQDTLDLSFLGSGTSNAAGPLKDFISNSANISTGGIYDPLYSYNIPAGKLANDGDKIFATYAGMLTGNTNAKSLAIVIGGTQVNISPNVTTALINWKAEVFFIRTGNTTGRLSFIYFPSAVTATSKVVELTDLDFNNPLQFNLLGAGAAGGDIVAKLGTIRYEPAAALE